MSLNKVKSMLLDTLEKHLSNTKNACLNNYKVLLNFRLASYSVRSNLEWGQKLFRHVLVIDKIYKFVSKFGNGYLLVFSSARLSRVPKWFPVDAETLFYVESLHKKFLQNTLGLSVIFLVLNLLNCSIVSRFLLNVSVFFEHQNIISEFNDPLVTGLYLIDLSPCLHA